ncbi:MAG: hypothetical protein HY327_03845 [Chloroflexi bacterium]|nr:hypothetical protein [Chloroflexota bacterium]
MSDQIFHDEEAMESAGAKRGERFKTIMALMMALVTIIGAGVAWRAALADDEAGDTDYYGWTAAIATEETVALHNARLYQHYGSYTAYTRYAELGDRLDDDLESAPRAQQPLLERLRTEAWDVADTIAGFFPLRYVNHDGTYNSNRELGEQMAEASQQKDLNPERHYTKADGLRDKSTKLFYLLVGMALSLWFFTLAEAVENRAKYLFALLGTALVVIGSVAALAVEMGGLK